MSSLALNFNNVQFDVVDRDNQPWLRANQIGLALVYKNPELSVNKLYRANADEFTDTMTALVEVGTAGGKQKVRIFSLRGCHLLAMFARTAVAKLFRKWVLDILDREVVTNKTPYQMPLPTMSDKRTRVPLKDAVTLLVAKSRNMNYSEAYGMIHQRFDVDSVEDLTTEQVPLAVEYIHRVVGEFIGKAELPAPKPTLDINYPVSWIVENNKPMLKAANTLFNKVSFSLYDLTHPDVRLPTKAILNTLKIAGYCVEAAEAEMFALYNQLSKCRDAIISIEALTNSGMRQYSSTWPVIPA